MGKKLKASGSKILQAADIPQKYAFDKLAEYAGSKKGKDAESTAFNLVQKAADKLGLPDSTATNVLKSLGVAGLTTFADPNPLGKIGKGVKAIKKLGKAKNVSKIAKKIPKEGVEVAKGTTLMKGSDVQGKGTLPSGASEKAAIPLVRAEKVSELGKVTQKNPDNFTQRLVREKVRKGFRESNLNTKNLSDKDKQNLINILKTED